MEIKDAEIVVVKVGTSTLTYENGKVNLHRMEELCRTLSDLQNAGRKLVLVSSGAIGVGMGKIGLAKRPEETEKKQALAAIGQCELMFLYDKFFGEYNHTVAQVLLTADVVDEEISRKNVVNTFRELLTLGVIPVVNENDTVETSELEGKNFGDNDTLSAIVAQLVQADALVILTDIDGLYSADPRKDPSATLIHEVKEITPEIQALAGGAGSNRGTGGMATKIKAAKLAGESGIPCGVISGGDMKNLYGFLNGETVGTVFRAEKKG
jgi:glutamate 5-kinase